VTAGDGRVPGLPGLLRRRLANTLRPPVRITPPPPGVVADWDVPVAVRDGTVLRLNVFRPAGGDPVPALMSAHLYGKDRLPARTRSGRGVDPRYRLFPHPAPVIVSAWTSWEAPDPAFWVPRGYAVVNADLRGAGTSDGIAEPFSDAEARDYHDLVEWVGTQPWCTGRVGLDGVSYLAISQYKVAATHPPHLAAICPWEGLADVYRDFARPGGVPEDRFTALWSRTTRRTARVRGDVRQEIVARPEDDAWYASLAAPLEDIQVPALICGSFSDHSMQTRGAFEAFRRVASKDTWLHTHREGKWSHYYSPVAARARERFFDHVLKGEDNGWDAEPRVRLAVHEAGAVPVAVVGEDTWPPADLTWTDLLLDAAAHGLAPGGPDTTSPAAATSVPTHRGTASFTWTVPEDLDVIGPMALRLHVEVQGVDDVYLFAGVRKLRGGREVVFEGSFGFSGDMVSKGWQRAAHRELDAARSTPWQPVHTHRRAEPLAPGEIVPVDVELRPHATRFRAGEQLRLDVQGHWFYSRGPVRGQFPLGYRRSAKGTLVLHTGAGRDARLRLGHRPVR